ncbi:hypothetical protein [Micromonospora sp. CPCC 205561]
MQPHPNVRAAQHVPGAVGAPDGPGAPRAALPTAHPELPRAAATPAGVA